jgi:DNA-binding CsgD family transcriptional regulator
MSNAVATPPRVARPPLHLTPRESEIVRYVMLGESNKQIARRLGISNYTVRDHVSNLLKKAGVSSRSRLALVVPAPPLPAPAVVAARPAAAEPSRLHAGPDAPRVAGAFWRTTR